MPSKFGDYTTATDKSQLKYASSEGEMDFNTSQVLAAAGSTNESVNLKLENPNENPNIKLSPSTGD